MSTPMQAAVQLAQELYGYHASVGRRQQIARAFAEYAREQREFRDALVRRLESAGCSSSGCDPSGWHPLRCPLGVAAILRAGILPTETPAGFACCGCICDRCRAGHHSGPAHSAECVEEAWRRQQREEHRHVRECWSADGTAPTCGKLTGGRA